MNYYQKKVEKRIKIMRDVYEEFDFNKEYKSHYKARKCARREIFLFNLYKKRD